MTQFPLVALVDDDHAVRQSLASLMRAHGYRIAVHASGPEMLAEAMKRPPDALITDMQMPGMSGLELLVEMKRCGLAMPVIVVTAFPSDPVREACLARGALACLSKPLEAEKIIHLLEAALSTGAP